MINYTYYSTLKKYRACALNSKFTSFPFSVSRFSSDDHSKRKQRYSKELRAIYVNFTVALLHNKLNIDKNKFNNYSSIIKFLENHKGDKLFTRHHISKLRYTKEFKRIPLTSESLDFINYVKKTFPEFNDSLFVYKPSTIYPKDQQAKAKTAKHSLRSIYLWILACWYAIYEKFNYLFIILPCFILLILAIKDNPELLDAYIKEWNTELNTITSATECAQTYNTDYTSWRIPAGEAQDMHTAQANPFGEQHMFDSLDSWDHIYWPEGYGSASYENSYPDITNFYKRIEGVTSPDPVPKSMDTPVSSSLDHFEDIPSRWPSSNTAYMQTKANTESEITVPEGYSDSVIYAATSDTYPTIKDITKAKSKSSWWLSMLDFNNLNYFPSLFEDLSKPRETYTIVQGNDDSKLNNQEISIYKRYTNNATSPCYLENAILQHENLINTRNTTISSSEANLITDIISFSTQANPVHVEATAKATSIISKLDLAVPSGEVTAENMTLSQNSTTQAIKTNTPSLSYNLNRDSVSSTYSKYFYSEDLSATNIKATTSQVNNKAVADTQIKLLVSEHIDDVDNTNNKKTHAIDNAHKFSEPVTPEAIQTKTKDKEIIFSTTTSDNNQATVRGVSPTSYMDIPTPNTNNNKIEPLSPYSPSIISSYIDTQVSNIHVPKEALATHNDASVIACVPQEVKTSDLASYTESIKFRNDLTVPELKPTKITPPLLDEDHTASIDTSIDLIVPEAKPTKISPPLLDDDYDLSVTYTAQANPTDPQANPKLDTQATLYIEETVNKTERPTNSTENKLKLDTNFNTRSVAGNLEGINSLPLERDLSNAKNIIVNNNKHIIDIELNLDTLRDRVNSINDECSSLVDEKEVLTIKLYNSKFSPEHYNVWTIDNDNTLATIYKNAYNSLIQWGFNPASPVNNNDVISKLISIDNKLNSLQETKLDLLSNINNNINSLSKLKNHNLLLREFIDENSIPLSSTSNS